jgi:hypothetical protein
MTTADEPLAIRPPAWARVLGPVFLVVWLWAFLVASPDGVLLPALVVACLVVAVVGRMLVTSVLGTGDGRLTVRNRWSTRTFGREEILGVEIDRSGDGAGRGWALWLLLADGTRHRLDVTEAPFLGPSTPTLQRQAAAIGGWLEGGHLAFR